MERKYISILFIILVSFNLLNAQGLKAKLADESFNNWDYYRAAGMYDELAKMNKLGKRNNWEEVRRAAQANIHTRNYQKAKIWFEYLNEKGQLVEEDYADYIDVLCRLNLYDEASIIGNEFYSKYPANMKAKNFQNSLEKLKNLNNNITASNIQALNLNSKMGDFSPVFYDNGIVFSSSRKNNSLVQRRFGWDNSYYADLYYAPIFQNYSTRKVKLFNRVFKSNLHDATIAFNKDFTYAVFSRNEVKKKGKKEIVYLKLYEVKKDEKGKWSNPVPLDINQDGYSFSHPALSSDGSLLIFVSDMPGGEGGTDIWYVKNENNQWSKPINAGKTVNTPYDEMFPTIDEENNVYFSSNGHLGLGGLDIFITNTNFNYVENIGKGVNSNADDFSLIKDYKNKKFLFTSDREDNVDKIFEAKLELPQFRLDVVTLIDDCKNSPLPESTILLKNLNNQSVQKFATDINGNISINLPRNGLFEIFVEKDGYVSKTEHKVSTLGKNKSEVFKENVLLQPLKIRFKSIVKDAKSDIPLHDAKVVITNLDKNNSVTFFAKNGIIDTLLERAYDYEIEITSAGFLKYSKTVDLSDKCMESLSLDTKLEKMKIGDKFIVNNIFYDYGKADLRVESMIELDKLATFLIENSNIKVELSSHTDSRSSDSFNLKLSQKRAESAVNYLIKKGVRKENIIAKGYGEKQLVNRCSNGVNCSEEEHQQNRRTEIKILEVR
ncbi:MAG: OmpA family protein [Flavobacteriales bacterium]|nr:OmpA family protein [Flavobacteriales bacterium]